MCILALALASSLLFLSLNYTGINATSKMTVFRKKHHAEIQEQY